MQRLAEKGRLRVSEAAPNPNGGVDRLFLLDGDGISAPIDLVERVDMLPSAAGSGRLRVFHFNDLHNNLTDLAGSEAGTRRFSQMVQRVRRARAKTPDDAILFLSIGDDHTGSVFDELIGWNPAQFRIDASYRAFSAAGVDLSVLGNHEFDRGAELLSMGIRQDAGFPVLCANAHGSEFVVNGLDYHAAAIAQIKRLRVGMIGLLTHIETRVGQPDDPNFAVASPIDAVQNILPALEPLVDVVLILSHCGYGDGSHKSGKAAAVRDIGQADFSIARAAARLSKKPLLILGGHTHTRLNETGFDEANRFDGVPIFQTEANGRFLGEIDLDIRAGSYEMNRVLLHPIRSREQEQPDDVDEDFERNHISPMITQVQDILSREITEINTQALNFSNTILARYAGESALLNFMCDAVFSQLENAGYGPDLVMMNGATVQSGIEQGRLSMGDWFRVVPYADQVFMVDVTGAELAAILDNNAARVLRPEEIAVTDFGGFLPRGFAHFSAQLRYQLHLNGGAGEARAKAALYKGQPLPELAKKQFRVAMPTYLALGAFGENWNGRMISGSIRGAVAGFDLRKLPMKNTSFVYRDVIAAYLREVGPIEDSPFIDGRLEVI